MDDYEELVEKATTILKGEFSEIKEKGHAIPYMLLSCYLEKISTADLEFLSLDTLK